MLETHHLIAPQSRFCSTVYTSPTTEASIDDIGSVSLLSGCPEGGVGQFMGLSLKMLLSREYIDNE